MQSVLIGFVLGASIASQLPWGGSSLWLVGTVLLVYWWRQPWCQFCLSLLLGLSWIGSFNHQYAEQLLPDALAQRDITTINQIISLPQRIDDGWRFLVFARTLTDPRTVVDPEAANSEEAGQATEWHGIVRISWYQTDQVPRLGDSWQWLSRLKPPVGFANDAGMDYERYLLSQNVQATGYVRGEAKLLDSAPGARQQLRDQLLLRTAEFAHQDLMLALTLGDRSYISPQRWRLLSATGTSHLIAISGLHIGLIFWLIYNGLQKGFARRGWATNRVRSARALFMLSALALSGGYAVLSGFAVPAQRAWWALAVWVLLTLLNIRLSRSSGLLLLMALVILLSPEAIYGASFWLSFAAVANIGLLHWYWCRLQGDGIWQKILALLLLQCGLSLLMIPVTVLQMGFFAPLTPVSNLLVVPLITFIVVPLLLLACALLFVLPALSAPLFYLAEQSLRLFSGWLEWLTSGGIGVYYLPVVVVTVVLLAGGVILLSRRIWPLALCLLAVPILLAMRTSAAEQWQVDVIDVGQGLAVLVRQGDQSLLYDTGNRFKSGFVVAEQTVLPLLRHYEVDHLDYLVLSHDDIDHTGGAEAILNALPVSRVISPSGELGHRNGLRCRAGVKLPFAGLDVLFLSPEEPLPANNNNQSCVLRLADATHSLLLAGDVERAGEQQMLADRRVISSEWLVVPHHGSDSSSSPAWLSAVAPRFVVISRGPYNRYGMPAAAVLKRYQQLPAQIFDTACSGQISIKFTGHRVQVSTQRAPQAGLNPGKWYQRLSGCRHPR